MNPGATASVSHQVTQEDTAAALGSGSVPVLATPRLLAWCEQAAVAALDGDLDVESTTVGVEVRLDHVAASPVGRTVRAEATLDKVKGRRLYFTVSAHDDRGLIAVGKVVRVTVHEASFLAKYE
jgi:fluoroacetyl-CoA thioesterase